MSTTCAVTIARAVKPRVVMAKIINVDEDGMITGVEPSPQGFLFEFREVEVHDLESLAQAIAMAARDPYSIVVRGKPKQAVGRRAMYDDPDAGPANLTVTPRRWAAFDWDNIPVPHDPEFDRARPGRVRQLGAAAGAVQARARGRAGAPRACRRPSATSAASGRSRAAPASRTGSGSGPGIG